MQRRERSLPTIGYPRSFLHLASKVSGVYYSCRPCFKGLSLNYRISSCHRNLGTITNRCSGNKLRSSPFLEDRSSNTREKAIIGTTIIKPTETKHSLVPIPPGFEDRATTPWISNCHNFSLLLFHLFCSFSISLFGVCSSAFLGPTISGLTENYLTFQWSTVVGTSLFLG